MLCQMGFWYSCADRQNHSLVNIHLLPEMVALTISTLDYRDISMNLQQRSAWALIACLGLVNITLPVSAGTPKPSNTAVSTKAICGPSKAFPNAIDLDKDRNRDGIPDDLAALTKRLDAAKTTEAQIPILEEFMQRLPYSAATRALEKDAKGLSERLMRSKSEAEAAPVRAKMAAIEQKAMQDPCYVKTMEAFRRMTTPKVTPTKP